MLLLVSMIGSCQAGRNRAAQKQQTGSGPSTDWLGSYQGTLPCADCSGIITRIKLSRDQTFEQWQQHAGAKGAPVYSQGYISRVKGGNVLLLKAGNASALQLRTGGQQLSLLDSTGKPVMDAGGMPYALYKEKDGITERYWKLIALSGKPVVTGETREPHLILKSEGSLCGGHGGCNQFGGHYKLKNDQLSFQEITTTELYCADMSTETAFYKAIAETAFYQLTGDTLLFQNTAKQTIAKFVVVYLR